MKTSSRSAALLLVWSLLAGTAPPALAQAQAPAEGAGMSTAQLEQIVAPIALYPDTLLTQILMASTYPLEVVEAQRWVSQNSKLKGKDLDAALKEKEWDPSVKALCSLPDVLKRMSENLDWTQDLGDAFLGQKSELMDTVQRMRGKALEAGNLKTTEQQVVTQQPDKIIVIESAEPEVVYVPTYSPTVVYGGWGYSSWYYPPMYYPPPPGYGFVAFSFGVAMGAAIWGDCNWGWGHSDVDIDIDRYNEFNRNTNINADRDRLEGGRGGKSNWQHDPSHRKGVNYGNQKVAQQYGARGGETRVTRDQARGRTGAQAGNLSAGTGSTAGRAGTPGVSTSDRSRAAGGAGQAQPSRPQPSSRDTAMSGSRSPSMDRASSSRGAASRGTTSYGGRSSMGGRSMGGGGRRR